MKVGVKDYIRAAFNARPVGMWVPPNWIGVGLFAIMGLANPGFWILGMGLEFAYLYTVGNNPRFQRVVNAAYQVRTKQDWEQRLERLISDLAPEDQHRYRSLEDRCRTILKQQTGANSPMAMAAQGDGLRRLLWIYMRLLLTRESITRALSESAGPGQRRESLEQRIDGLETRLKGSDLSEELRRSLMGQIEILKLRQEKQQQARDKLAFLEAELTRIQEQAELIREQAVLTTSPEAVSQRIDQISETLGGTTQWIQEQQQIYGSVEDLLEEPPPLSMEMVAEKEVQ